MRVAKRLRAAVDREPVRRSDLTDDELAREIQAVLKADKGSGGKLILARYRGGAAEFDGYCAVAAAAYFFLAGGRTEQLQPVQYTDRDGSSHWWLQRADGDIIDLIYGLGDDRRRYRHYGKGRPRGFMQTGYRRPSARAAEVMRRVEAARARSAGAESA